MKRTSTGRATLGPDAALVQLNNAFADRQAKTKSIHLTGQAILHPVKALKDSLQVLRGNAHPVVTNTDLKDVVSLDIGLSTRSISPCRVLVVYYSITSLTKTAQKEQEYHNCVTMPERWMVFCSRELSFRHNRRIWSMP